MALNYNNWFVCCFFVIDLFVCCFCHHNPAWQFYQEIRGMLLHLILLNIISDKCVTLTLCIFRISNTASIVVEISSCLARM